MVTGAITALRVIEWDEVPTMPGPFHRRPDANDDGLTFLRDHHSPCRRIDSEFIFNSKVNEKISH
jgi:hypothetical protein